MGETLGPGEFGSRPERVTAAVKGNGAPHRTTNPPPLTEAERELYLQSLLAAFEEGKFDAYEYSRRAEALEKAASTAEAAELLRKADLSRGSQPDGSAAVKAARRALDPVDIALMSTSLKRPDSRRTNRYMVLVVMAILLVVLVLAGIWLQARVRADVGGSSSGNANANANSAAAVYYVPGSLPASPLSPRR